MTDAAFPRDANYVPITNNGLLAVKTITYAAGTTGATGATTLFTVTGSILARAMGICTVDLESASGTMSVGIAGNTAGLIASTTVSAIDAGEGWTDSTPDTLQQLTTTPFIIHNANVIQTIAVEAISAGTLTYYLLWTPLSADANVTAA